MEQQRNDNPSNPPRKPLKPMREIYENEQEYNEAMASYVDRSIAYQKALSTLTPQSSSNESK